MAMNNPRNSSGGRSSLAEINVTPLVDVMLVLLIVFMISAPLLQQGIQVNLPKADAGALPQPEEPVILSIQKNASIQLDHVTYSLPQLSQKLVTLEIAKPNLQVMVQADQAVNYGVVAKVMAAVKKAKINRVGLVTAPETE
jgi:biopolymer transport protein TolR